MEYIDAEVWLCVDANGCYTVATDPGELDAADPGVPARIVKVTVKVPTPRPAVLVATVADEPTTGEVKAA